MSLMVKRTASQTSDADYDSRFREIIEAEWPGLEGRQIPEVLVCREGGDFTHGEKAIKLAGRFGINLMPWQRDQVLLALALDDSGKWLHSDVALICPRQNGKSLILEVIILYRVFVLSHQVVFSAHQWRTAKSIRNRIWRRIKSKNWAAKRLTRNTASAGEAEMETAQGGKVQFTTRSNDMGRGFDQIDVLIIDEAYNLDSGELDAVAPTQLAAEDPQTYYASSAVNRDNHPKGEELSRIRERAMGEGNETTLFSEFAAPDGLDPDSPETWKLANPSYGVIATEKKIRSLMSKLSPIGFKVEMLGWGLWFEFIEAGSEVLFDLDLWASFGVDVMPDQTERCLGVEVSPDGERVVLVSGGLVADSAHLEVHPQSGEFDVDETLELIRRYRGTVGQRFVSPGVVEPGDGNSPLAVILDPSTPSILLEPGLKQMGCDPVMVSGPQVSASYQWFMSELRAGKVTHDGNALWQAAWSVAERRSGTDGKWPSFDRFTGDVGVLVAAAFAVWGLAEFKPRRPGRDVAADKKRLIPAGAVRGGAIRGRERVGAF